MNFSKRYLLWLLVPPAVIAFPLALLFISQLLRLDGSEWTRVVSLLLLAGLAGQAFFFSVIRAPLALLESSIGTPSHSEAASDCLRRTIAGSLLGWSAGTLLFATLGSGLVLPSRLGLTYFIVAALGAAAPSIAWSYAAGKRMIQATAGPGEIHYVGPRFLLGRKIAAVFIGFFVISAAALVLLVSARVSTTLEELAIGSAGNSFDGVYAVARGLESLDQSELTELRGYLPADATIYHVSPDGTVRTAAPEGRAAEPLTELEIREMLSRRTGDTSAFISPNVGRFGILDDGSVLFVAVPWDAFRDIPRQVAFYTFIITLLTTAIFVLATYFLSTDVGQPIQRLSDSAELMAAGDFRVRPWVFSDDEVGELGDRFAQTRENLERLIGRMGSSGRGITDGVRVIGGGGRELLVRSREQAELTESSSDALGRVREGAEAVLASAEGVAGSTHDASSRALELQASAEEVARSMGYLFESVEKTSGSTTEMDGSAREMSGRTSFLADIGEEVLSFVTQMETTIDELRTRALATAELSRRVREDAGAGGGAVNDTVEGIREAQETTRRSARVLDELQSRIGRITQILTVIEEITERTNLLSLNAAIIAAQAGEHGAGFSVVAGEIRELADRTRGSTKEISAIIKAVQGGSAEAVRAMQEGLAKVDQNVGLARNAAGSLEKIVSSADESYDMANRIAAALEEQASATRHLHEVTSRMSDHISEINRATQEQARGTRLLAEEAERVREIALQVRNSTDEQSQSGRGITTAMEQIAGDVRRMRDLLETQLSEMQKIAEASKTMLGIAQRNEVLAREFEGSVSNLVTGGQEFEAEIAKFTITGED
ncbi:MAG TPA: methyl-accepting chemotaxis protein [Thermoanaerobaculia bacterium]|nr:methyl-accepting chemotaxis protein [Thermoanaerobaculia bacterium]